ncbi:uncharacterized protein LOC104904732 isoform X8 [Beta vulgaris subsp. vulgaris]|uniref:uncharacterized protein LOC104904732 isoform X8 n=1 Tax=Beta vulgaris subsp. vulgaris TaxID=3555 RepID=UPI00053F9F31|nr:uncharacterized protein LOC104904732 isoform X8 [Beta vulgaris subsp. vulgaris]
MKEKQLDDGGDTNKGRNFELDPNLPKSFCQNCRHPLSIVGVVDSFRLQGSSLQGADSVGFLTYGPFVCRVAKAKVSDTWCFSSSPRRWSSAGNVSVCWCRWDFINNSNTSLTTATLETVSFSVLHEMRPPLTLHQHPMCAEIIEAFQKCHGDHPFVKIFGNCTELKIKLDRCFRQEKINYKRVTFGLLTQSGMSIGRIKSKNRLNWILLESLVGGQEKCMLCRAPGDCHCVSTYNLYLEY